MHGSTNAAEVNGDFAKMQWTSDRAQAEAVRLGTQMNEISAKNERLKSGMCNRRSWELPFRCA